MSPAWAPFLAFVSLLAVVAVALARQSARFVREGLVPAPPVLYANVVGTQAVVVALLGGAAWLAGVPVEAFGTAITTSALLAGLGAGVVLAGLSALASRLLPDAVDPSRPLRDVLEPRDLPEALALYCVALPAVAVGEELLFRGALVGAVLAGTDLSPWVAVVGSSALFGYAHSAQGRLGVLLTGVLGAFLAWVFLATDSLLAVVVAHYVVNAAEFAVGDRIGAS